jgi:manganese oxidase
MVEITVTNESEEATAIHWHGLHVPNDQDGVAGLTQPAIEPGQTFTYRFPAPHPGTFMYHAHGDLSRSQLDRGLYAPFVIDPAGGDPIAPDVDVVLALQGWMVATEGGHGSDPGGMSGMPGMDGMPGSDATAGMDGMSMDSDHFTINGKSFPDTEPLTVRQGDLVRLRFINPSQTIHPMHLQGMDMAVSAKDGEMLVQPQRLNTLTIAQGETYDVAFIADTPGTWLLHCHDLHHASNAGVEPGGLVLLVEVSEDTSGVTGGRPSTSASLEVADVADEGDGGTAANSATNEPGSMARPRLGHSSPAPQAAAPTPSGSHEPHHP